MGKSWQFCVYVSACATESRPSECAGGGVSESGNGTSTLIEREITTHTELSKYGVTLNFNIVNNSRNYLQILNLVR